MFTRRDCLIATIAISLAMGSASGAGQAKPAAGGAKGGGTAAGGAGAEKSASGGAPEPCANGVAASASQVGSAATEVGKTADALGKSADAMSTAEDKLGTMEGKMTKVFNGFKKPATTTASNTAPAANSQAKPATGAKAAPVAAKPAPVAAKPAAAPSAVAAATTNASTAANGIAGATGAAGGASGSGSGGGAPCAPAKNKDVAGGGGGSNLMPKGGPSATPSPGTLSATAPTFTPMPDGDTMLGYVGPGATTQSFAKVKLVQAATPASADNPHDGIYTDGKAFYTVSGSKLSVTPIAGTAAAEPAPGGVGAGGGAAPAKGASGLVADVAGGEITVNMGTSAGVKVGSTLDVVRPRVIKDPATGKDLKTVDTKLGSMTVTSADETSATGKYTGTATKVGDTVRAPQ